MDKSWITAPKNSSSFVRGFREFIDFAIKNGSRNGLICCPCKVCLLRYYLPVEVVEKHVFDHGFWADYNETWHHHGERFFASTSKSRSNPNSGFPNPQSIGQDDMGGLLHDLFGFNTSNSTVGHDGGPNGVHVEPNVGPNTQSPPNEYDQISNEEAMRYKKLVEDCNEELYPGCTKFSNLSFVLRLIHLKCMFGWSSKSVTMLLTLLIDAFPLTSSFPKSFYEAKNLIKGLDLQYHKIHACPNDCMLYWGEQEMQQSCSICGTSRWKLNEVNNPKLKEIPAKVMRYFPLIPRLKRLYSSSKIAKDMRWHDEKRTRDGILRHPADGLAWREFDTRYPDFASDPRSIRLGLASDGFNPFGIMSSTYSIWPIVLIPYNLPPWLCMKQSSLILSTIIPGEKGPGNDIDIFLQPLIHELKLLWDGVDTYDAFSGETFKMRAAIMWTINDFPAYANLSGWSTKGRLACPSCGDSTHSIWLKHGKKFSYMGHRRWLPCDHIFRMQRDEFDGTIEKGYAPIPPLGANVFRQQQQLCHKYGKGSKVLRRRAEQEATTYSTQRNVNVDNDYIGNDGNDLALEDDEFVDEDQNRNVQNVIWKKRSIFFDLPYWEHNLLRHNLDVMHIEKNVCDNLLGTLLSMDGKTKDSEKARKDLQEMHIRPHLHLIERNNKLYMPPASYTMSSDYKVKFLTVLKHLKVPDGYASNISRCVNLKERKLQNLKSHDCHILMQDILPVALRASGAIQIVELISDLCSFFKFICSKILDVGALDEQQSKLVLTLCNMEKVFPPSFFTIMVHLVVHLVEEAKHGGPVQYRWMYPIERFLLRLKDYVRNRAQPEGSIAEGYIIDECLIFCSRYFEGVETIFNRPHRNEDSTMDEVKYLFHSGGCSVGTEESICLDDISLEQAHRYVLLHADEMGKLREDFLYNKRRETRNRGIRADETIQNKWITEEFSDWLRKQVPSLDTSTKEGELIRALARGPNSVAIKMRGFICNGYKFITKDFDGKRKTQNSGVMVDADGETYYGKIKDIYEISYYGHCKVVIFRCDWVDIRSPRGLKRDRNGMPCVNFSKLIHIGHLLKDDPFIFSSQAKQVFYVEDAKEEGWLHVVFTKPRDIYDMGGACEEVDDNETFI